MKHLALSLMATLLFPLSTWASAENDTAPTARHCWSDSEMSPFKKDFKFRAFDTTASDPICNDSPHDTVQIIYRTFEGLTFLKNLGAIEQGRWLPKPEEPSSIWDRWRGKKKNPHVLQEEGVYNYFKKRVETFFVFNQRPGCGEDTVAFVSSRQRNSVFLCSPFRSAFNTPLLASYVLVHEARHINGFKHAACGSLPAKYSPYFLGAPACDENYEEQGSYGIAASFLLGVYDSTKNDLIKQEARAQAALDLVSRFNVLPFPHQEGALALQEDGQVMFYDGKTLKPYAPLINQSVQNLSSRFGFPIFYLTSGTVRTVELQKETVAAQGLFANTYETQLTPTERHRLIDVLYDDELSCFLFEKHLMCRGDSTQKKFIEIPLLDIRPRSIQRQQQNLVLIDEDGTIYAFPEQLSAKQPFPKNVVGKIAHGVVESLRLNTTLDLGVSMKGQLLKKQDQQWVLVQEAAHLRFKKIVPLDIYEDLNNL